MSTLNILHGCATIQLTKGQNTLVDEQDWLVLSKSLKRKWSAARSGDGPFYAVRTLKRDRVVTVVRLHQEVLKAAQGEIPPGMDVDHRNRDSLDNRRENLRLATRSENLRNSNFQSKQPSKTSQYRGVCWQKRRRKWNAQINLDRRTINLGYFDSEIEAARVYNHVAEELFGEFAQLNEGI